MAPFSLAALLLTPLAVVGLAARLRQPLAEAQNQSIQQVATLGASLPMDVLVEFPDLGLPTSVGDKQCVGDTWGMTNPSFVATGETVKMAVRASCVTPGGETGYGAIWHSKLIIGEVPFKEFHGTSGAWNFSSLSVAQDPRFHNSSHSKTECLLYDKDTSDGPEDPKIFSVDGHLYVLVTGYNTVDGGAGERPQCGEYGVLPHVAEVLSISPAMTFGPPVKLKFQDMHPIEKNWGLFVHNDSASGKEELMAVYSVVPHTIKRVDLHSGKVEPAYETPALFADKFANMMGVDVDMFRGGAGMAALIDLPGHNYYLSVLHMSGGGKNGKAYKSWPYKFSAKPPFEILEVGEALPLVDDFNPFYVKSQVSFVTSVNFEPFDGGSIAIGYGSGDTMSRLFRMRFDSFEQRFFKATSSPAGFLRIPLQSPEALNLERMMAHEFGGEANLCHGDRMAPEVIVAGAPYSGVQAVFKAFKDNDELYKIKPSLDAFLMASIQSSEPTFDSRYCAGEVVSDHYQTHPDADACWKACIREDACLFANFWTVAGVGRCRLTAQCDESAGASQHVQVMAKQGPTHGGLESFVAPSNRQAVADSFINSYLERLPPCNKHSRKLTAEYSMELFSSPEGPRFLSEVFTKVELKTSLRFIVVLRDPLTRFAVHASHYITQGKCQTGMPSSMDDLAERVHAEHRVCEKCSCNDALVQSNYTDTLTRSFMWFRSSQFHIVPHGFVSNDDLLEKLRFYMAQTYRLKFKSFSGKVLHDGVFPVDMSEQAKKKLQTFFYHHQNAAQVAEVLVNSDAELHGISEFNRKQGTVRDWLHQNW